MARLKYLNRAEVEIIAHGLAANLFSDYGEPLPAFQLFGGLRERGALMESALGLPQQPYYRTIYDKAGALLRSLIKNHPLVDGNKRVAMASTIVFLAINGQCLIASNQEMVSFALEVAASEPDMPWRQIAQWLRRRTVKFGTSTAEVEARLAKLPGEWSNPRAVAARLVEYGNALDALGKRAQVPS